jgi:hypothetical protein
MDYSKTVDYSNTYWSRKGKYPEQNAALEKLIPDSGAVPNPRKNKALERFRVASNCYYDLYNNGLCNRAASFAKTFGFSGRALMAGRIKTGGLSLTQTLIDQTETWMDEIVLAPIRNRVALRLFLTTELNGAIGQAGSSSPATRCTPANRYKSALAES